MSDVLDPTSLPEGLDISAEAWHQTPLNVRLVVLTLLTRLEALEARLHQDSSNSSRPPSTDAPLKRRQRHLPAADRRKPGAQSGPPGHPQVLLEPTATVSLLPDVCACGQRGLVELTPYHVHQGIALPGIHPDVTHWLLHQGRCLAGGTLWKASLPDAHASGYGPRLTAYVGERAGMVGASRSAVQARCASVCGIPLSTGAIQKLVDRVSAAIVPHYETMGQVARQAPVHDIDETSWLMHGDRHWL